MREIITTQDIARETGYSACHINYMRNYHRDFPRPVGRHTVGRSSQLAYDRGDIARWLAKHNKRPLTGRVPVVKPCMTIQQKFLAGHYRAESQRLNALCKKQRARLRNATTTVVHIRGDQP
jgi:predicted DNA-binding transcriptional regulator AlpA